jgi:hypothetical protein
MNRIQKKRTLRFLSCKSCSSCQKALFGWGFAALGLCASLRLVSSVPIREIRGHSFARGFAALRILRFKIFFLGSEESVLGLTRSIGKLNLVA